jgi:hypothetical protein
MIRLVTIGVAALLGCSSTTTGSGRQPGQGNGGNATGSPTSGDDAGANREGAAVELTDEQLCDGACAKLMGCGVDYPSVESCASGCLVAPVFLACVKTVNRNDCNQLAICAFREACGDSGVPSGTATCSSTALCQGNCNVEAPGDAECACACLAEMSPAKAVYNLANFQCAIAHCESCQYETFDGDACNQCAAVECGHDACVSN